MGLAWAEPDSVMFTFDPAGVPVEVSVVQPPLGTLVARGNHYLLPPHPAGPDQWTYQFRAESYELVRRDLPRPGPGDNRYNNVPIRLPELQVELEVRCWPSAQVFSTTGGYRCGTLQPHMLSVGELLKGELVLRRAGFQDYRIDPSKLQLANLRDQKVRKRSLGPIVMTPTWSVLGALGLTGLGLVGLIVFLALRQRRNLRMQSEKLELLQNLDASSQDHLLGSRIEQYRLVERLGSGGMATVYRGQPDSQHSDAVACKIMRPELSQDEEYRQRFLREIKVCSALDHPNIVRTYGGGIQDGLLYLLVELLSGESLDKEVALGPFTWQRAWSVFRPLLQAMGYAHRKAVVHRDLKPANVIVSSRGQVKVLDFGLAVQEERTRITVSGAAMGTPSYMPPEQFSLSKDDFDARSDQYALGVMFFEMLAGQLPFRGDFMQLAMAHLSSPPPAISSYRPDLPSGLDAILRKMMAKKVDDRYPDLAAVEAAILDAIESNGDGHQG